MFNQILNLLSDWSSIDSSIVATGAAASMACAVPGVLLYVRRQSMMGDALSHTALPGIVAGFFAAVWLQQLGWIEPESSFAWRQLLIVLGAIVSGIVTSALTEFVHRLTQLEPSAALGVVYTSLFALGLLVLRLKADGVDIDPDCVLYGTLEASVLDTWTPRGVPRDLVWCGGMFLINSLLVAIFFKELRLAAFDPQLASTLGVPAAVIHYIVMAVTAVTLVVAFHSVGSILVIAMLVTPAAAAQFFTDRLGWLFAISVLLAAISALAGHVMAICVPPVMMGWAGLPTDVAASSSGMIAVAAGFIFISAAFIAPRHGVIARLWRRMMLAIQIAQDDILGFLYRAEESGRPEMVMPLVSGSRGRWLRWFSIRRLLSRGAIQQFNSTWHLTDHGRKLAAAHVQSHRLWESYMARHFAIPDNHLHETAERVEHFIDEQLRSDLVVELDGPRTDPHGRSIPGVGDASTNTAKPPD